MNAHPCADAPAAPHPETLDLLRRIGLKPTALASAGPLTEDPPAHLMRVLEVHREQLLLHDGRDEHRARAYPALLQALAAAGDGLAVGDWVRAQHTDHGEWWIASRVPPRSQIARRLHDGRDKVTRQVVVSNVDTALLVMGLDHDFNLRRLERYLALVRMAEVEAVVVLTKADLCPDADARRAAVQALLPQRVALVCVNALDVDATQAALAPWLGLSQTLVLLGSSGTGKSTLTNALLGHDVQDTGANRAGDSRGRHTTTSRSLHQLPSGACIIDTPGVRTLRLDADSGGVEQAFDDIATLAQRCRFRDCRHQGEPGCAVEGQVDAARLRNFHKLRRETERDQLSALQRKAQVATWKVRARAARERIRAKSGE